MLDENRVVSILCDYLQRSGYEILQRCTTDVKGIDVIAKNPDMPGRLLIEVKGATSSKAGSRRSGQLFSSSQVLNRVGKALYKAAWMDSEDRLPDDRVAIAFPDLPEYRRLLSRIEPVTKKLDWDVLFVSENSVELGA